MTSEFEKNLEKYAEVIVKIGLNLQSGQRLLIGTPNLAGYGTPIELAPLVRLIASKAYQIGAKFVDVMWDDDQIRLARFKHAPRDSFQEFPKWRFDAAYQIAKAGDAVLIFISENPELLINQNHELIATTQQAYFKNKKKFSDLIAKNAMNWTVITAPIDGWIDKVLPDIAQEKRKAKFWDIVFEICRVKEENPVTAWKNHLNQLITRSNFLNQKKYTSLKLKAPGTDLNIGLPKGHIWRGGSASSQKGITFTANIPTEEIFTLPHKDKTEGFVKSTKPLFYGGGLIEDFELTFSEGRIVKAIAKKGEKFLLKFIETDEGARRLGEIALVPHSSPISQSGLLFYNTLIDENASNHIALGRAYRFNMDKGETMTDDEFAAVGGNYSLIHIDFMIGSGEMDVDGMYENGTTEPIMRKGEWAFDI